MFATAVRIGATDLGHDFSSSESGPASRPRSIVANVALLLASLAASLVLAEGALRLSGYRPYTPVRPEIRIEPGGMLNRPDRRLGYTHLPGRYTVTFDNGDSWVTTHRADTLRVTRPEGGSDLRDRPRIWIFGCSFVHGWGLMDDETLPWKVQERLPAYDVANFGVGGYSTVQSLLQFKGALERGPAPVVAVLAYAGFHDERNTLSRHWRKATYEYEHLGTTAAPYARLGATGLQFAFDNPDYAGFGLLKLSALAELADEAYAPLELGLNRSHRVSELLVEAMAREAAAHGARFVVAGISREPETEAMIEFATKTGIPAADISVDLTRRVNRIRYDGHPSAAANVKSAERLRQLLRTVGVR